jgi:hypothetical protein
MSAVKAFLREVMTHALAELEEQGLAVYTLAFYLDHESAAVSVCADTRENSERVVARINSYNSRRFLEAVRNGDFESASLWQANLGRSLSLGDFAAVNVARTDLGAHAVDSEFCQALVAIVVDSHDTIRRLSPDPADTILAASTLDDEVGLVWALPATNA